jgi:hypothetical protein
MKAILVLSGGSNSDSLVIETALAAVQPLGAAAALRWMAAATLARTQGARLPPRTPLQFGYK